MICKLLPYGKQISKTAALLAILAFSLGALKSNAQETRFGIKAGLNYSSIVGDLTEGLKFRFSGHGGLFLELRFTETFSLQPELQYSSQGFQFSTDLAAIQDPITSVGNGDFRTNVQLNYLNVPIVAKFALGEHITLDFGPQFGFLLNQVTKIKLLDETEPRDVDQRNSIPGDFQLDYGGVLGLGFRVSDTFFVSPRMYLGLRNRLNGLPNAQNYNVALQLSANYVFRW